MPHLIIEYSNSCIAEHQISAMMLQLKESIEATGLFNIENLKIRLHPAENFMIDSQYKGFIHAQCRLHSGRSTLEKEKLSRAICNAISKQTLQNIVITVEIVDMDTASYSKTIT